jgi:hypothetical protein
MKLIVTAGYTPNCGNVGATRPRLSEKLEPFIHGVTRQMHRKFASEIANDAKAFKRSTGRSDDDSNVREAPRRLGGDRLLADSQVNRSVRSDGKHDVWRVVRKGATVPFGEPKHGWCSDLVRQDVGQEPVLNFLRIRLGIVGSSVGGHDASDCLCDGFSISRKVIGRAPRVEPVAKVFVVLCEQGRDHGKTYAVDRTPSPGVGGER